jgi:hypothetical protein
MTIQAEARSSDSDFIESVMHGRTLGSGSSLRPAEAHWHMVFARQDGWQQAFLVGPWSSAGKVSYGGQAEILWIQFKLGVFMPHLPTNRFRDTETVLPPAASQNSFWLHGSAWQFPEFEDVESFIGRLAQEGTIVKDPLVQEALRGLSPYGAIPPGKLPPGMLPQVASRTLRHRFLQSAGLSHSQITQFQRALQAAELLERGVPILDTVFEAGYYDQPHLTRALKHWVGRTPGEISQSQAR